MRNPFRSKCNAGLHAFSWQSSENVAYYCCCYCFMRVFSNCDTLEQLQLIMYMTILSCKHYSNYFTLLTPSSLLCTLKN